MLSTFRSIRGSIQASNANPWRRIISVRAWNATCIPVDANGPEVTRCYMCLHVLAGVVQIKGRKRHSEHRCLSIQLLRSTCLTCPANEQSNHADRDGRASPKHRSLPLRKCIPTINSYVRNGSVADISDDHGTLYTTTNLSPRNCIAATMCSAILRRSLWSSSTSAWGGSHGPMRSTNTGWTEPGARFSKAWRKVRPPREYSIQNSVTGLPQRITVNPSLLDAPHTPVSFANMASPIARQCGVPGLSRRCPLWVASGP